jgi:hypothetical protein
MFKAFLQVAVMIAIATTATAADVAYIYNKSGGKIVFTDSDCTGGGKLVFANNKTGQSMSGCWFYSAPDEFIRVIWSDSELYQYPITSLTMTKYGTEKYENKTYY